MVDWLDTPAGRYLTAWERAYLDACVADIFGYHALQLGWPQLDALHANRMPHQWLALDHSQDPQPGFSRPPALVSDFCALPFASSSLDLIVLPHTLEFSADPHATLREVERVLVPEGRVLICGLNPLSLWGFKQARGRLWQRMGWGSLYLPDSGQFLGHWRLRDWLQLLSLEVEACDFGCYRPAFRSEPWLQRFGWMEQAGARWWPILGSVYCMVAVKRVRGMRMLGPSWKAKPVRASRPVSVAHSRTEFEHLENQD